MACGTPTNLMADRLTTTATTYYTVPANTRTIVTFINMAVGSEKWVNLWIVPSGQSAANSHKVFDELIPDAKLMQSERVSWVMQAGDFIVAQCQSNDSVSLRLDGIESSTV